MNAAEQIAASRPPDHVDFVNEEPVFATTPRRRAIATDVRGGVFSRYVHEYTEVEDYPLLYWKRDKIETWHEAGGLEPVFTEDTFDPHVVLITVEWREPQTVARRTPQVSTEPGVWRDVP